jgi:hypothetical protein
MVAGGRTFAGRREPQPWELQCRFEHADLIRFDPARFLRAAACCFTPVMRRWRVLQETQDREEIIERVAALDIGKAELACCARVPAEGGRSRRLQEVETYSTMTRSLLGLSDRLRSMGVTRVVMEATSDYWKPVFYVLEAAGFETWLVNARDVKHLPGRPKTDKWVWPGGHPGRDEMLAAARRARSPYPEWSAESPRQVWRRARGTLDCRFEHEPQLRLIARSSPVGRHGSPVRRTDGADLRAGGRPGCAPR